jgi:pimeloyl-ACP methyl ester carboxylesterase
VRSLWEPATPGAVAATRIVLLPGAYHAPEDLVEAGFLAAARARRPRVDLQFVDLELRHLTDRDALEGLRTQIVVPARAAGCASVWLMGASLGGYIALDYASLHPRDLRGICLLAPFLGDRRVIAQIARAPGVAHWQPGPADEDDMDRRIWRFIKTCGRGGPLVYLGCGREDRYAFAHELLAAALPPGAAHRIAGGHDLATWRVLWEMFLDSTWL